PKEIKSDEYRVAMMPVGAELLVKAGHQVMIEANAGTASGFPDADYIKAGAMMVPTAKEIFANCDMIQKVKEPQPAEIAMFRPGDFAGRSAGRAASACRRARRRNCGDERGEGGGGSRRQRGDHGCEPRAAAVSRRHDAGECAHDLFRSADDSGSGETGRSCHR